MSNALLSSIPKIAFWSAILCGSSSLFSQTVPGKREAPAAPTYTPHMVFDVASIRESGAGDFSYVDNAPKSSMYHAERVIAAGFLLYAYDLKLFQQLKNVPDWAWTTRYDLTAKSDDAMDEALAKLSDSDFRAEKQHMLRELLAERFKLQIHSETRLSTTYELLITPRAAKLMTPVKGDVAKTVSTCNLRFSIKGIERESKGCPFPILLSTLSQELGTEVLDHTGLSGMYAYHLMWAPTEMPEREGEERYPNLVDAVREQLGLELKKTKGPVTFWVVDSMERPTPN